VKSRVRLPGDIISRLRLHQNLDPVDRRLVMFIPIASNSPFVPPYVPLPDTPLSLSLLPPPPPRKKVVPFSTYPNDVPNFSENMKDPTLSIFTPPTRPSSPLPFPPFSPAPPPPPAPSLKPHPTRPAPPAPPPFPAPADPPNPP